MYGESEGESGGSPAHFLEELRCWQKSVFICIQIKLFSVVRLEVHFIVHGLGVGIIAKFILYILRLFTGWKVRIEKTVFEVLRTARGQRQTVVWLKASSSGF